MIRAFNARISNIRYDKGCQTAIRVALLWLAHNSVDILAAFPAFAQQLRRVERRLISDVYLTLCVLAGTIYR